MKEIHLFIIWSEAAEYNERIVSDIKSKFEIVENINTTWTKSKFSENLSRFYGENLPRNSNKEKHCGNDTFKCIIVRDNEPCYDTRETSKGLKVVNTNLFDAKKLYREWTGGGHKIHATDDTNETRIQLALLFSKSYDCCLNSDNINYSSDHFGDLVGSSGWKSFDELFKILNLTSNYVILRNFEDLEQQLVSLHPDIDLLVDNKEKVANLINASKTTNKSYRVQYEAKVDNKLINFDLRHVGDGYYCDKFEMDILKNRVEYKYFYVPQKEFLFYSLIYHALIHKSNVSRDYIDKIQQLSVELNLNLPIKQFIDINLIEFLINYLYNNGYKIKEPIDLSVFFNIKLINKKIHMVNSKRRMLNKCRNIPKYMYKKVRSLFKL